MDYINHIFRDCEECKETYQAALKGHLDCLKYLHENECHWDDYTCSSAAWNGHLECLKYAHENGCKWDEVTVTNAIINGHLECLKYAYKNGCELNKEDEEFCYEAILNA